MKKILAFVVAAVLAVTTLGVTASAADSPYVKLYSENGTEISVYYTEVDRYRAMGWYTNEEWHWFNVAQPKMQQLVASGDYLNLYWYANLWIRIYPYSPVYSDTLYKYRTEAMNTWRLSSGSPLGVTAPEDMVRKNNDGTVDILFYFTNTSYKPIIAFETEYDICNVFGEVLCNKKAACGENKEFYLPAGETDYNLSVRFSTYDTSRYNLNTAKFIRNVKVTKVVFSDGTSWTSSGNKSSNGSLKTMYHPWIRYNPTGLDYQNIWLYK